MISLIIVNLYCLSMIGRIEKQSYIANVSAYCPCKSCCGPKAKGISASGKGVSKGMIAAPRNVPFGTRIYIPGYGEGTVEDRGGAIKGNKLDVYFPTHKEALKWGRKRIKVRSSLK
jgi:3D (Asp-Asp-Asp) domain-containing protein